MTIEKAEKARKILDRIDELNDYYKTFHDATSVDMTIASITDDSVTHMLCRKGSTNGEIVRYILDGIMRNIDDLKEGLNDL